MLRTERITSFFSDLKVLFEQKRLLHTKVFLLSVVGITFLFLTAFTLYMQSFVEVEMEVNGDSEAVITQVNTVDELLMELNIEYTAKDKLSHSLETELQSGMEVVWKESVPVTLEHHGEQMEIWTTSDTVEEVLSEANIDLEEADQVLPGLHHKVNEHLFIEVAQYTTAILEESYEEDFKTEKRDDSTIYVGQEKVVNSGQSGEGIHKFKVNYKNGEEINRIYLGHDQIKEQENRIVAVGTKPKPEPKPEPRRSVSTATISGGNTMQVTSTAYTAYCNGCSGITRTGLDLRNNPNKKVIAVDPNVIPLGSIVEVEGYGRAIAGDTGGAIKGNKIDVFFPNRDQALSWGRRSVNIKIIE